MQCIVEEVEDVSFSPLREETCFFCSPEEDRVLYSSEHFYVLLGLGPIVEGYILLVAKEHIRSIFDLPENIRKSYIQEKARLKQLIKETYGPAIVTEHGRVQACVAEDEETHDLLCYHAHQLFFPVQADLSNFAREGRFEKIFEGDSLFAMPASLLHETDEYLLFEDSNDRVHIYKVIGKCPRQFMRYLVASHIGRPELANWQCYPGRELIDSALARYREKLSETPQEVCTKPQEKQTHQMKHIRKLKAGGKKIVSMIRSLARV